MSDTVTPIPLQVPTSTVQGAMALGVTVNGSARLVEHIIPSHPVPVDTEWVWTTAATDAQISGAQGAGVRLAITQMLVHLSSDATVDVRVRIGWAATALQAESPGGVGGIVINQMLKPGGTLVLGNGGSVIKMGPANTPLRQTNTVPTGGRLVVMLTGFFPQIA